MASSRCRPIALVRRRFHAGQPPAPRRWWRLGARLVPERWPSQAHSQAGDPATPAGRVHLGERAAEEAGLPGPSESPQGCAGRVAGRRPGGCRRCRGSAGAQGCCGDGQHAGAASNDGGRPAGHGQPARDRLAADGDRGPAGPGAPCRQEIRMLGQRARGHICPGAAGISSGWYRRSRMESRGARDRFGHHTRVPAR
jgi:hypothetical protein